MFLFGIKIIFIIFNKCTTQTIDCFNYTVWCGSLVVPIEGNIVFTVEGDVLKAVLSCTSNMVYPSNVRSCQANNTWSIPEPSCVTKLSALEAVHVNFDDEKIWNISTFCHNNINFRNVNRCGVLNGNIYEDCPQCNVTEPADNVTCSVCEIEQTKTPGLFSTKNGTAIIKSACSDRGCSNCNATLGCMNQNDNHTITLKCWAENGHVTYFQVDFGVIPNSKPVISVSDENIVIYSNTTVDENPVIVVNVTDSDACVDLNHATLDWIVEPNTDIFNSSTVVADVNKVSCQAFNEAETYSQLLVNISGDVTEEYSQIYQFIFTATDRRSSTSKNVTVIFCGCVENFTCGNVDVDIRDTHGLLGITSLWNMSFEIAAGVPDTIRKRCLNPTWALLSNGGLTNVAINAKTGKISVTGKVHIHPAFPSKVFDLEVQAAITESCNTTCTVRVNVSFTNYPPRIDSLPAIATIQGYDTEEQQVHILETSDDNHSLEDNVTCLIHNVSLTEEVSHFKYFNFSVDNRSANWTTYTLYKTWCENPGCIGDKLCPNRLDTIWLNFTIVCTDDYGSRDQEVLSVNVNCTLPECGTLSDLLHGYVNITGTSYSSNATYTCDEGYYLNTGVKYRTCNSSGLWTEVEPTCAIYDCGNLTNPVNGKVDIVNTTYMSNATYDCDTGHRIEDGNKTRTCDASGKWIGKEPKCTLFDCGVPTQPEFGKVEYNKTIYLSEATYTCDAGYSLEGGTPTRTCNETGNWNGSQPNCTIVDCGSLPKPVHGLVYITGTSYRSNATYTCDEGYYLKAGVKYRSCNSSGLWTEVEPTCTIYDCGNLTNPVNGKVDAVNTTYMSNATYDCDTGHQIEGGNKTRTCDASGKWKGEEPKCTPLDCGVLTQPEFGKVEYNTTIYLSEATYTCPAGYSLEAGTQTRTCNETGNWNGSQPNCTIVDCGVPTQPAFGEVEYKTTIYLSESKYTCQVGYSLEGGTSTRTCNATGYWNGSQPYCAIVACPACIPITVAVASVIAVSGLAIAGHWLYIRNRP